MADRTLAIISLVLAVLVAPIGLILGIVALVKRSEGRGLAIAAVVIGAIGTFALPILILIGSAAYYGVLNPESFIPEKCTFSAGLDCTDYTYDGASGRFILQITNGFGRTIELREVRLSSPDFSGPCEANYAQPQIIANGVMFNLVAEGPGCVSEEESIRADIEIDYAYPGRLEQTMLGEIFVKSS